MGGGGGGDAPTTIIIFFNVRLDIDLYCVAILLTGERGRDRWNWGRTLWIISFRARMPHYWKDKTKEKKRKKKKKKPETSRSSDCQSTGSAIAFSGSRLLKEGKGKKREGRGRLQKACVRKRAGLSIIRLGHALRDEYVMPPQLEKRKVGGGGRREAHAGRKRIVPL